MTSADWLLRIQPDLHLAGSQRHGTGECWLDARRVIYDHELMCFGGDCEYQIEFDDRVMEFSPGGFVILPPGVWHAGHSLGAGLVERAWIHFNWIPAPRIPEAPVLTYAPSPVQKTHLCPAPAWMPEGILSGRIPNPGRFFTKHQRLCRLHELSGIQARLLGRALLLEILGELLTTVETALSRPSPRRQASDIRRTLQIISLQPFCEAPLLKDFLQQEFSRSYEHLCRRFKGQYGITPLRYIQSLRMGQAKRLLLSSDKPVADLARELGFRDPVYFNRLFKHIIGCPPGQFRSQRRK